MAAIDAFATTLLEEAKRFLELACDAAEPEAKAAHLHASLLLGFSTLEAHTNAVADDLADSSVLTPHEKALLLERDVRLDDGEFKVTPALKMTRLEDRIQFLHRKFSASPVDRTASWWSELGTATELRNKLTHPKDVPAISEREVKRALGAIIDVLNALYLAVYKTKFPPASRGLQSRFTF